MPERGPGQRAGAIAQPLCVAARLRSRSHLSKLSRLAGESLVDPDHPDPDIVRLPSRFRSTVRAVPDSPLSFTLIEFPADDPERARRFWAELLGVELEARKEGEGSGWQSHSGAPAVGVHERGRGPGDSFSLPYFAVSDIAGALERVEALGGSVVHPGEAWAICKDSEGSPFALAAEPQPNVKA